MEPGQQPDAGEARQVRKRLLESTAGQKFHHVLLGPLLVGLVQGLELHLFRSTQETDWPHHEGIGFGSGCRRGLHGGD